MERIELFNDHFQNFKVHCNPWRNIELMKAKAEELGIDLKEKYELCEK